MNVEQIIIALASAAAVAALFAVAWGLGFRGGARLESVEAARALIAENEPDVRASDILLDKAGKAALAQLADGRFIVIRAMGDRFAVRAFPEAALTLAPEPGGLRIRFADLGFPALRLRLEAAEPTQM
jgi:hypothetical protein